MKKIAFYILTISSTSLFAQEPLQPINLDSLEDISSPYIEAEGEITSVLFDGEAKRIAISSTDHVLSAYDLTTENLLWEKKGEDFTPIASAGIPGSGFFFSAQSDEAGGKIKLLSWDVGNVSNTLESYTGKTNGLAYQQGKLAWAGKNTLLQEYDLNTNQYTSLPAWQSHRGHVSAVSYTEEGDIVTGGDDGIVIKWNGPEPEEMTYFDNVVTCVASSKAIKNSSHFPIIAASDASGALQIIGLHSGDVVYEDTLTSAVSFIHFHPTDPDIIIVSTANKIYFIDLIVSGHLKVIDVSEKITSMDLSADGSVIALGTINGNLKLYRF